MYPICGENRKILGIAKVSELTVYTSIHRISHTTHYSLFAH